VIKFFIAPVQPAGSLPQGKQRRDYCALLHHAGVALPEPGLPRKRELAPVAMNDTDLEDLVPVTRSYRDAGMFSEAESFSMATAFDDMVLNRRFAICGSYNIQDGTGEVVEVDEKELDRVATEKLLAYDVAIARLMSQPPSDKRKKTIIDLVMAKGRHQKATFPALCEMNQFFLPKFGLRESIRKSESMCGRKLGANKSSLLALAEAVGTELTKPSYGDIILVNLCTRY
jgi:hypothetical protein